MTSLWPPAGSPEELRRRRHQEAADRQLRHADQPGQDGRALPVLQPAAAQPAGHAQEARGPEAREEEPGATSCRRLQRAQLLLREERTPGRTEVTEPCQRGRETPQIRMKKAAEVRGQRRLVVSLHPNPGTALTVFSFFWDIWRKSEEPLSDGVLVLCYQVVPFTLGSDSEGCY